MEQWYKDAETEADAMLDAARLSARQPKTDELTSASEGVEALGQNMKLSVPQEFEDKAVSPQELQTVEDNFKTFAPTNPSEFFVPSVEKPDPLLTSFPSKREQINTARGKGYTDEQIALSMNRLELEQYTKGKTPAQIDELFGRTEETKALYDWQMKNLYADEMAFRLGLTKEDVLNRIDDARVLGVAPDLFLRDEDFWRQLCESSGVKTWRFGSLSEAAKTAAQIRLETDKSASLLWNSMTDPSIKDDSQLIAQLDKNGTLRHLQQGKTTNFFQDVAFSAADLWTQWGQSGLTGLKYLPAYTGAALAVGAKTGGLLNPFGAGAALGTGVAASLAHGAFEHTLKVESASEYATLRGMNVDKPTAALLALVGGAVKAGIEMNIFSRLSEYIPGMPKMDKFLSLPEGARSALAKLIQSEGVSPLVQIPTIRNALASRAKKYAADVGSNTVEEVMQDGVDILTEAIAAYLADNSNMPPQEAIRKLFSKENAARLVQTAAESAKTFAYGMLPAAAINSAGAGWSARQVQKTPQAQRAEALNNWHAAQSHKGNGEQASLSDVVFIPAEVLQQFNQGAADEQIGADETVAVESTGEVMMSRAAYEKLAAENEEFAKATASKVRVGAFGRTFEENAKILRESETDPLNDPNDEWAREAREIRDEITQEMKDAGFDDATAEAAGTIYAKNRLVRAVRLGTDELGIRRDDAKSPKQLRQLEIDNQRVQSERAEAEVQQNAYQKHGMKETMQKWAGVVNEAFDGKAPSDRKTVKVMDTPLVFDLLGGSFSDINGDRIPVTMDLKKIYSIAHGLGQHEHYLSREDMKQIPRAMADPIAVFEAKSDRKGSESNGLVFILDITDTNGSTAIAAVHMQTTGDGVEIHKLASYYGKDKLVGEKVIPRDTWFSEEIKDGRLMYMNTKKTSHWETQHDLLSLAGSVSNGRPFDDPSIKTEADLVDLLAQSGNRFYKESEQHSLPRGQISFTSDGRSIVSLFERADRSTFFHELGHFMLEELIQYGLDENATDEMKHDLAVAADYLGIGRLDLSRRNGQFSSAEAEQYRRAQEEFARSFEAYLMTGRAPTAEMTGLFGKLRRWLLNIYADVARLNVQLSPEIQDLFDRMLATPDEIDASRTTVAELANEDSLVSDRLNELERVHIPRVVSAMWDSAGLSDADMPDWVPPQLIHDSDPSEQSLRPELVKAVKKYGGIDYNSLVSMWGKGEAKELFDRDKSLFRKKGQKFDLLAQWLSEEGLPIADAHDLWNRLMAADPENASKELNVAIDETTLPWLFYLMTDEDVLRYAKTRERRLNKELKNLQSRDDHSELRAKGTEIYHELTLIGEIKKELNNTAKRAPKPSPDSDAWYTGEPAEFSPDMFTYEGTAEHESIPTQEATDKAAGVRRDAGETIALSDADRAAWKRAERFSRQAHRAGVKEERARGREQLREARKKERLAYKEGLRVQKEKEAALRAAQKKRKAQKDELNSILRAIKKAASDKQLSWGMKLKISEKLKDYTLSKPPRNRLEAAQQLKEYLEQTPEADMANFSPSDQRYIKILETTTLWDMTLEDVRQLGAEIESMRQQGREEYDRWVLERDRRRDTGWNALMSSIGRTKANDGVSTVITSNDLKKHYASGIGGTLEKVKDWAYANTLGANRFFDWIGGGRKDYTSAWTQYFVDDVDTALDEELRWRQARYEAMETRMKELKLSPKRLNEIRYVDGQAYPVDALIHIYAGLKNEHSRKAILYGNMGARFRKQGEAAAQEHAAHCVAALTEAEKALGDAVIADFSESFDRLNAAYIDAFNEGMTPEENYTPMKRLEYTALDLAGLRSDASEAELLEGQAVAAGSRNAVLQKGFLNDRMDISEEHQQPIYLGLLSLWHDQVAAQEHTAAYGKLAGDLRSMLTKRDERGETLGRVIKQRFGSEALGYLREYTNIVIEGQAAKASEVMDGVSGYLGKNMAVAYLALNLGSVLKQFSSLPRFLVTAGPTHIFSALYDFMKGINPTGTNKLLDEVYALDPQMKNRSSDAFVQVMNDARKLTARQSVYKDMLELTMKPISYMDKVVACIGWKATYQSNIKRGLSHADAVREAKRAVALTQQTPLAKDMPRIWNQRGLARLFMLFTSDAANTWGMTVYDLAHGKGRDRLQTAAALALTALLIGYMQGGPDDDEEWIAWYMSQLAAQQIGSVPMAGKELMSAVELISRGYGNTTYSAISSPFIKLGMGLQSVFADDAAKRYADGATKRERGLFMALEGVSLLAEFPFTLVNRIRRMARSEDAADAARVLFGMRREARRGQRYRY